MNNDKLEDSLATEMCDCISKVNEKLSDKNTVVDANWIDNRPFISTAKLDTAKRGKPVKLFASFCPFCGEKYA